MPEALVEPGYSAVITINTEKGLIQIETWADVAARPGFTTGIDPKAVQLDAVIGSYLFDEDVRCGLSTCNQPHGRGYVVTTKDGRETNIGKDCGRTHFGIDFDAMQRRFDRDLVSMKKPEAVRAAQHRAPALLQAIADLRREPRGADWIQKSRAVLLNRGTLPNEVVRKVTEMAQLHLGEILVERVATEAEAERLEAIEGRKLPRPQYMSDSIGKLDGVPALYAENDATAADRRPHGRGWRDCVR